VTIARDDWGYAGTALKQHSDDARMSSELSTHMVRSSFIAIENDSQTLAELSLDRGDFMRSALDPAANRRGACGKVQVVHHVHNTNGGSSLLPGKRESSFRRREKPTHPINVRPHDARNPPSAASTWPTT